MGKRNKLFPSSYFFFSFPFSSPGKRVLFHDSDAEPQPQNFNRGEESLCIHDERNGQGEFEKFDRDSRTRRRLPAMARQDVRDCLIQGIDRRRAV